MTGGRLIRVRRARFADGVGARYRNQELADVALSILHAKTRLKVEAGGTRGTSITAVRRACCAGCGNTVCASTAHLL
ncbi:MAG: hypothetical protein CMK50_03770 [Propionibacteriaceae bacterium]|nr:hypothetical protein [Propionibacteriaceae bacterium]